MALFDLMREYVKPGLNMDMRAFNVMESPVQCSSDVWISPSQKNIIIKRKQHGKRSDNKLKTVWEFLQYRILNQVFKAYSDELCDIMRVEVPSAVGVKPQTWELYTEFAPGFILSLFNEHAEDVKEVRHLNGKNTNLESSIALHLGAVSKIKELEGIYHHDFDLRHLIFDPNAPVMNMFDLENTRYSSDKELLRAESAKAYGLWLNIARARSADMDQLVTYYQIGRDMVVKNPHTGYTDMARQVGNEFGIDIQISKGCIDGFSVGLTKPKVKG